MQVCCPDGARTPRHALSQSQAMTVVTQTLCAFPFASRDRGECGLAPVACSVQPTCVRLCVCVYLKRTVVSDLHYWRRTRVACLTTLCEMLELGGQTAEKQRV